MKTKAIIFDLDGTAVDSPEQKLPTKEHAITELLSRIGVKKEHTIGIGDGHNDLHLFNSVATKIAMGNAVNDLKQAADLIIDTVENEGLTKYFETLK